MTLEVTWNVYCRIIQVSKTSDKPIPIMRYKPAEKSAKENIIKIQSTRNTSRARSLVARVVDIKECDIREDELPHDDLRSIYDKYLEH
jgi:hypothetical protein